MKMTHEYKGTELLLEEDMAREPWQGKDDEEASATVVLRCVFAFLPARELWLCGSVSRTWRRVADDDALWRRLLVPNATPHTLRVLAATTKTDALYDNDISQCCWRKEYYRSKVQWRRHSQLIAPGTHSAPLLCAALHPSAPYLAILDEDALLTIWENMPENSFSENLQKKSKWTLRWRGSASESWCKASHAQWAPRTSRLLLTGCLALTDRSELLVLEFSGTDAIVNANDALKALALLDAQNENLFPIEWHKTTICRSACGPGGGCWVDDAKFLTMQLQLAAPALAFTTVWLTAASQETQSEHTGVTTPLLRIFNEVATHVSHFLTVEISNHDTASIEREVNKGNDQTNIEPTASYYRALRPKHNTGKTTRLLIAACGTAGGVRGKAEAVAVWALPDVLLLPQVQVWDALAERVQLRRDRALRPPAPVEAPEEHAVRAICTPPAAVCNLFAQIFGFVLHPRSGCIWVSTALGASCVSLPGLHPLLHIPYQLPFNVPLQPPHYLWPTVDDYYFTTPAGYGSRYVAILTLRSARHAVPLQHEAPALAALLLPRARTFPCKTRTLLVLTSKALDIWEAPVD